MTAAADAGASGPGPALVDPLAALARSDPDRPVIVTDRRTYAARELLSLARARAARFSAAGVGPGVTVALAGPAGGDWDEWIVTFFAVGYLGGAVFPIGPTWTRDEIARALRAARPAAAWIDDGASAGAIAALADLPRLPGGGAPPPWPEERPWPQDEARAAIATSGTSGTPRVAKITAGQLFFSAFGSAQRLGHLPGDRWLACLPFHHIGGLSILTRCAILGATAAIHPRFDADRAARALDSGAIALASFVPAMLARVLSARGKRPFPPALRAILVGGGPLGADLRARCRAIGAPVAETWGMTETASQAATSAPGDLDGRLPPLSTARVWERGGTLWVGGPIAAGEPSETADRGRVDDDGRVVVTGRRDDVIVSSGYNIDPAEVEAVLCEHPEVIDAAAVGLAGDERGEIVAAAAVARGRDADSEAVVRYCRGRLAPYKVPRRLVWLDRLPRGELGKLSRAEVRARLREAEDLARRDPGAAPSRPDPKGGGRAP